MDFVNICRKALYFRGSLSICPAYAGMILTSMASSFRLSHLSRVCGDDPGMPNEIRLENKFVPRMRG